MVASACAAFHAAFPGISLASWAVNGNPASLAPQNQLAATSIPDGAGGIILVWEDYRNGNADIFAQRVSAAGDLLWGANGLAIAIDTLAQEAPVVTSNGAGGAIIAWQDLRAGQYDIYAQAVSAAGAPQWTADGVAVCAASGTQVVQGIVSDNAGGAIVAWRDLRTGDSDVYAQRVNGSGASVWTANGAGVCVLSGAQSEIRIEADPRGGAFLVWRDRRGGLTSDIYAQSIDLSGAPRWTANGVSVCAAADDQIDPATALDGRFGLLVAWQDRRNGVDADIWAQRVKPDGTPRWTVDGVRLTAAALQQTNPSLVSDGVAGAIVGWTDARVTRPDVYAQRIDSSGVVSWLPADGVAVCAADSSQFLDVVLTDGAGGAIFGWDDDRSGGSQIYSQSIGHSGTSRWGSGGVLVATGAGSRTLTTAVPDGYHGAVFGWQDFRNGPTCDVYAFRLSAVGTSVETTLTPVLAHIYPARPNPFNPSTVLAFDLERPANVHLAVYDARGRLVRTLYQGSLGAGRHQVRWDGMDRSGSPCGSGVYFARLSGTLGSATTSLALIR